MAEPLTQQQMDQIADVLVSGRKIEAIKIYRQATGEGLKEAKDFIDALIPKLIEQDPEKYAKLSAQGKGCASVIILLLVMTASTLLCVLAKNF